MISSTPISIAMCCDDAFAQHCAVTIASIMKNTDEDVDVHIFGYQFSLETKNKLNKLKERFTGLRIIFHDITIEDFGELQIEHSVVSRFSNKIIAPLSRLLAVLKLKYLSRLIYLDCDVVVRGNIKELWQYDMGKHLLAARAEPMAASVNFRKYLGFKKEVYFNTGVMLLKPKELIKWGFKDKASRTFPNLLERLVNKQESCKDQDWLNDMFRGNFKWLSLKYNYNGLYGFDYPKKEMNRANKDPFIVHYLCGDKPWLRYCHWGWLYYEYLKETDYFADSKIKQMKDSRIKNSLIQLKYRVMYLKMVIKLILIKEPLIYKPALFIFRKFGLRALIQKLE